MIQGIPASLQNLIDSLISPDYRAIREASEALVKLGDESVAALEAALAQALLENQRTFIFFTLKDIRSPAAASVLLPWFSKESNVLNRSIIAEGLGLSRCYQAAPLLQQALDETRDTRLSWSIKVALAHLGEQDEQYDSYLSWLLEQADQSDESQRITAIRALQTFEAESATSKLLQKLQHDSSSYVKALSAKALTKHRLKHIQEPLEIVVAKGEPEASLFASLVLSHLQRVPLSMPLEELKTRVGRWPAESRAAVIETLAWLYRPKDGPEVFSILVHFLAVDPDRSVRKAVVKKMDRFKGINASAEVAETLLIIQAIAGEEQGHEGSILAAVALIKLGHRQYLDIVREYLLGADEFDHELTSFTLYQVNDELANDIIPFLLDLVDRVGERTQFSIENLLYTTYWRDPRLIPFFQQGLDGLHKKSIFAVAEFLRERSEEGYEPAYDLLKQFLSEEPSIEAIRRRFPWLPSDYNSTLGSQTDGESGVESS